MMDKKQLTFIDFFAGYGGGRRGLEQAGMKCIGFCEYDKYAVASYTSMHLITEEQRLFLSSLTKKQRQKEILKEKYRNGEWYWNDVTTLKGRDVPKADIWIFGAPCQSFSVAGKRKGLKGESGLILEILRVLEETEENRPNWIIYENVKGMFSSNRGFDYLAILLKMESLGYDIQWQLFNSADYVPQNRERVYTIGHLRKSGGYSSKVLSFEGSNREDCIYGINIVGHRQNYRRNLQIFSPDGITEALDTAGGGGRGHHTIEVIGKMDLGHECNGRIYDENGISPCLNGIGNGGNHEPKVGIKIIGKSDVRRHSSMNVHSSEGIIGCLDTLHEPKRIAVPILDSKFLTENKHKITIGIDDLYANRKVRFYENEIPTIRSDRQGLKVAIDVKPVQMSGHEMSEVLNKTEAHTLNCNDQRKIFGAKQARTMISYNIKKE